MSDDERAQRIIDQALARIARPDYEHWAARLASAGNCAHPVRLQGQVRRTDQATGQTSIVLDTDTEPDGVLLKACGTRRASRCPACAAVYRADARALILAGLRGGKGMPAEVADRPLVWATLTAPPFGPVHTDHQPPAACRPGPRRQCDHGRRLDCRTVHDPDDPLVGQPLCDDCYDYPGAVIWNATSGELWRRSIIDIRRQLRRRKGRDEVGLAFLKVAEFQRRGAVHFHALLRLDAPDASDLDVAELIAAITAVCRRIQVPHPLGKTAIGWGSQLDAAAIDLDQRTRIASYLAKYATKSVDGHGALDHRLHHGDLTTTPLPDHLRRLVQTAWDLGADPALAHLNLRQWAHNLGYRGHWMTKSRTWSTTLTRLRNDRHTWHQGRRQTDPAIETGDWTYAGSGHLDQGDAWLASIADRNHRHARRIAWEEQ